MYTLEILHEFIYDVVVYTIVLICMYEVVIQICIQNWKLEIIWSDAPSHQTDRVQDTMSETSRVTHIINLATYTNLYKNRRINKKNCKSEKKEFTPCPQVLRNSFDKYGTKLRYGLKQKIITYGNLPKNGIIQIHLHCISNHILSRQKLQQITACHIKIQFSGM